MKLILDKYHWFRLGNISVAGYILEGDKIISDKALIDYFTNIDTLYEFENRLIDANGQFSVIIEKKDELWLACDRVRNYPLFYTQNDREKIISDDIYQVEEGSFVTLGEKVSIKFYHNTINTPKIDIDADSGKRELRDLLESVFSICIKPFLPYNLVTMLTNQKNIVLYDEIAGELRKDMGNAYVIRPVQANLFNSYLIQWYLYKTRELVNSMK